MIAGMGFEPELCVFPFKAQPATVKVIRPIHRSLLHTVVLTNQLSRGQQTTGMGYHVIDPAAVSSTKGHPCDRRSIDEEANLDVLAIARYELAPGETLATKYHFHERREEAFYVLKGRLHVETPDEEHVVEASSWFCVEPGHAIRPYNPETAATSVVVLGIGAPSFDIGLPFEPTLE